jgi:hypothetical protein
VKDEAKMHPLQYQMDQAFGMWDARTHALPEVDKTQHHTWLNFGLRYHYAAMKGLITLENLEKAAGVKIFKSGPHGNDLDFNSEESFGHYNDAFIKSSLKVFKKAVANDNFSTIAEKAYDNQLKNLARVYYKTYKHLKTNPTYNGNYAHSKGEKVTVNDIKNMYLKKMKEGADGRSGNYLQSAFHEFAGEFGGDTDNWYNYNVAAGFWVRRMIDGSEDEIFEFLETVMNKFDKEGMN